MNKDIYFGMQSELSVLEFLKTDYPDIQKTEPSSHPYDFVTTVDNQVTYFELKTRRCNSFTYPDTMIGYNKILYAKKYPDKNYVFLFKFCDGLFKHHFNPNKEYTVRKGGRYDRARPEISNYAYIPITELIGI